MKFLRVTRRAIENGPMSPFMHEEQRRFHKESLRTTAKQFEDLMGEQHMKMAVAAHQDVEAWIFTSKGRSTNYTSVHQLNQQLANYELN